MQILISFFFISFSRVNESQGSDEGATSLPSHGAKARRRGSRGAQECARFHRARENPFEKVLFIRARPAILITTSYGRCLVKWRICPLPCMIRPRNHLNTSTSTLRLLFAHRVATISTTVQESLVSFAESSKVVTMDTILTIIIF